MQSDFLVDFRLRILQDKICLHFLGSLVSELIAFLLKQDFRVQTESLNFYKFHLALPTEMLLFNIDIQSHLRNALKIEVSILIRPRDCPKPIRYIGNSSANHFDLKVCTVGLVEAFGLARCCGVSLTDG